MRAEERFGLQPRERLLWTGAPSGHRWFYPQDWLNVPFSILWAGIVVYIEVHAVSSRAAGVFVAMGGAFILLGLYFVFGPSLVRRRIYKKSVWAVTDRRAIAVMPSGIGGMRVMSVPLQPVPPVDMRLDAHARGTLRIGTFPGQGSKDPEWDISFWGTTGIVFVDIEDPQKVRSAIVLDTAHFRLPQPKLWS